MIGQICEIIRLALAIWWPDILCVLGISVALFVYLIRAQREEQP